MKFCPQCGRDLDGEECSCGYKLGMTDEEYNELHKDELAVNPKGIFVDEPPKFGMLDTSSLVLPSLLYSYINTHGEFPLEEQFIDNLNRRVYSKESALMYLNSYLDLNMDEVVQKLIDTINK